MKKHIAMCSFGKDSNAQTFPRDYNFINKTLPNVIYLCGMSVPPVMIKRLVNRLIESGLFDYKLKGNK